MERPTGGLLKGTAERLPFRRSLFPLRLRCGMLFEVEFQVVRDFPVHYSWPGRGMRQTLTSSQAPGCLQRFPPRRTGPRQPPAA